MLGMASKLKFNLSYISSKNSRVGNLISLSDSYVYIEGFFLMLHLSSLVLKINRNKQNLFSEIISSHGGKVKRILIIAITKKKGLKIK